MLVHRVGLLLPCAVAVAALAGCRFFGIDSRPGIEYVTARQNKPGTEAMYARPVPGTNLVKRWPKRLGVEYGTAPWERKTEESAQATMQRGAADATTKTQASSSLPPRSDVAGVAQQGPAKNSQSNDPPKVSQATYEEPVGTANSGARIPGPMAPKLPKSPASAKRPQPASVATPAELNLDGLSVESLDDQASQGR